MACTRRAGCTCPQCASSLDGMSPASGERSQAAASSGSSVQLSQRQTSSTRLARVDADGIETDDRAMLHVMTNMRDPMEFAGPDGMERALQKFGPAPGGYDMMRREREAAQGATASGIYGVWRSMKTNDDCGRIGASSRCFCGAPFSEHRSKFPHGCAARLCDRFRYIPQRPEEVGEWWLPRRKGFDVRKWRAKCRCTHGHESHDPRTLACRHSGCGCARFFSAFCCLICDRPWEEHDSVFESRAERAAAGRPVDGDFMPLSETPNISALVFREDGVHGSGQLAGRDDASWRPAFQRGSRDGGGGTDSNMALPPLAAISNPTGRRESNHSRGEPRKPQQQQRRQSPRTRSSEAKSRPGLSMSSVSSTTGKALPVVPDPFYSQAVREVYAAHAPEKLSQVETILQKWSGREQALLMRLHKKYGRTMSKAPTG